MPGEGFPPSPDGRNYEASRPVHRLVTPTDVGATQARLAPRTPHCDGKFQRTEDIAWQVYRECVQLQARCDGVPYYQACPTWQCGQDTLVDTGARNTQPHSQL